MQAKSIRPFIGAKNYQVSKQFYIEIGFTAIEIGDDMTYFNLNENLGFYLQDAYVKNWVDNSMVFMELENIDSYWKELEEKNLSSKYKNVRLSEIKDLAWGRVFFLHDPSGILWQFGQFNN